MKRSSSARDKARPKPRQGERSQEGENQAKGESGERNEQEHLMGYPSPNLEQYFQFTLAVPSRDYSSSIHHSRPETHIIVQDQHIRQIVNVEDIQPKQEESPKDSLQSRGGQAKEQQLSESMDSEYRQTLNEFDSQTVAFPTQPLFCSRQSEDNQLTKLLCFKPNRKNARNLRYDEESKTVISIYTCYGCSKEFLVSSALGGHLSKCKDKAKHNEHIKQRSHTRHCPVRPSRPHTSKAQDKDINLKLEDFPIPFYPLLLDTQGRQSSKMREQNPEPIHCSEFTKILNHEVKIEESPQQYLVKESQLPQNTKPQTNKVESFIRYTRKLSKLANQNEQNEQKEQNEHKPKKRQKQEQQEQQEKQEQEVENIEGEDKEGVGYSQGPKICIKDFLMDADPNIEHQGWVTCLQLSKPENPPF